MLPGKYKEVKKRARKFKRTSFNIKSHKTYFLWQLVSASTHFIDPHHRREKSGVHGQRGICHM